MKNHPDSTGEGAKDGNRTALQTLCNRGDAENAAGEARSGPGEGVVYLAGGGEGAGNGYSDIKGCNVLKDRTT